MKKSIVLAMCAFMLMGCSNDSYNSTVSNNNDVVVNGSNISITNGDFYQTLMSQYGANEVLKIALNHIANKEIKDQASIDKLLKDKKDMYTKYSKNNLLSYVQSLGFKNEDEFIKEQLLPEVKEELLRKKYIDKNYDKLINDYQVTTMKYFSVDKESQALDLIKKITDDKSFEQVAKDSKAKVENCGIVTKNSTSLDKNLIKKLETFYKLTKDGVYKEAVGLSNGKFAIVFIYNTDRKDRNSIIHSLASDSKLQNTIESYYLKQYKFNVVDEKLKDDIKEISSDFIE